MTSEKDEIPLQVTDDKIELAPGQKDWKYSVDDPRRGRIEVRLSNYTDRPKIFSVDIKEVE